MIAPRGATLLSLPAEHEILSESDPYAAPRAEPEPAHEFSRRPLAPRSMRLLAALLDTAVYLPATGCLFLGNAFAVFASHDSAALDALGVLAVLLAGLVAALTFCVQVWMLHRGGWTLGKRVLGMRIVRTNGQRADLVHVLVLRWIVPSFLAWVPCLGTTFSLVDALFIFRADRRCLHDLLADTSVVIA